MAGKGGVGTTMVAGTLARLFARRGHRVLGLDSDPMPGRAISRGVGNLTEPMPVDAVEKDLNNRWHLRSGIGQGLRRESPAPDALVAISSIGLSAGGPAGDEARRQW